MEQAALASFVLADEGVHDGDGEVFGDVGAAVDFGYGAGEEGGVGFEAEEVVGGGAGDAVEDAADAGLVVVEQGGDDDVAGDVAGDEAAEVGFTAGDFDGGGGGRGRGGGAGEFEIAEDQLAEDGVFVGIFGVESGVGGAGETDAEGGSDLMEAGGAEVAQASVPEDDAVLGVAGVEQGANDGGGDGGAGAAGGAGDGMDFDADDVGGLDEAAPGFGGGGASGEGGDAAGDHGGHDVRLGGEGAGGGGVTDDDDAGRLVFGAAEEARICEGQIRGAQTKRLTKQKEGEYDSRHDATMVAEAGGGFRTGTLSGARMLTTSKPFGIRARCVVATGLMLWVAGCTPPGPKALLDGERMLRDGRAEDAIRRLRTAVEFLPSNPQAWNHLGLAYHAAKKPSEAVEAYQQALRLDRNLAVAYFNSGCLYLENGEAALATDALWAFVGLQPRMVEGWVKLGQSQLRTRRWDQAERSFQEALRLSPGRVEALNGVGVAFHQRRKIQEAWQSFTNAVMRDPGFAPAWMNLGVIAHQSGAPGKAVQAYRQYAALRPAMAQQMNLEAVIRRLELPPASPQIQLPPAVPSPISKTPAATNTLPGSASQATLDPAPGEPTLRPPTVNSAGVESPSAGTETHTPGSARPPPARVEVPEPAPSPAVAARPDEVPAAEAVVAEPTKAEPRMETNRETPMVAVTVTVPETTLPPSPVDSASVVSNAVASPSSPRLEPTGTLAVTDSGISNRVVEPDPEPGLVLPKPGPVVPSVAKAAEVPDPATVVPLDRVELGPAENLATEVRDETAAVSGATESKGAAPGSADGLAPLVRPVGAGRGTPLGDRRGFWSRANPVSWFGGEPSKAESATADPANPAKSEENPEVEGDGGAWRWANPMTWFRGSGDEREDRRMEVAEAASSPKPEAKVGARPESSPGGATQVPGASTSSDVAKDGEVSSSDAVARRVRRIHEASWTPRPTDPVAARADRERPELRRYAYLNPAKPTAGNRTAAKAVLAQGLQEHRRERMETAVRLYEEALRLDPALPEARQNLAVAALQLGDLPRALSEGETALALQPETALARLNFALALDRAGFPLDAAVEAERVVTSKPDDVAAHLLLGNLNAQKLDRPELARIHYRRVIELDPGHPQSAAIRRWLAGTP